MARADFTQRSNSSDGDFSFSGSLCSSNHRKSTLISSNVGSTGMFGSKHSTTNSNSAVESKQLSSQQTAQAVKTSSGLRVRFSCSSEGDQLVARKVSREQKSAKFQEEVGAKKKIWHLPQLHPNPTNGNTIRYSENSKGLSKSVHLSGEDRIRVQTIPQQRGLDLSQAHQGLCTPRPILKKITKVEIEEKLEELFPKKESCLPQRQNNWLRTIRLLEQNLERQELVAQLEEMQKHSPEAPEEEEKLQKQQVKPQSCPEQGQQLKLQLSQKKRQKPNCRSVSAHNVKTTKTYLIPTPSSNSKESFACRNVRQRERKSASKLSVYPANILVYDSESGALSAKLHLNPNNREKMFRKYTRSLSQG